MERVFLIREIAAVTPALDQACARKSRYENRWTSAEDKILLAQILKANGRSICWRSVAAALPGRNNKSCRKRWIHSLNPGLRKGRWTAAEDVALTAAVKIHGRHWFQVARMLGNGRTDDQCAKRWREALDPNIRRGPWGEHEDEKLIAMFRIHGRKWNDIATSLNGRPPVQCRNRWLSLVRAGRLEEDTVAGPEPREDPYFYLPAPGHEAPYQPAFKTTGSDFATGHFPLRRTSWRDHQTSASGDERPEQPQVYPPAYPEGEYREQPLVPPTSSTGLIDPGYYPHPHTAGHLMPPHASMEEAQDESRPLPVVAPTPLNLVIQTSFTRVGNNLPHPSHESDTSSGYGSTPPPTTASSTRSSFSFGSADSPTSPYDQSPDHTISPASQGYSATHDFYIHPHCNMGDGQGYQPSPSTGQGTSPYHNSHNERVHPHATHYAWCDRQYPRDYELADRECGYESEPESDEGWVVRPVLGYGFYTTPNQAAELWKYPSLFYSCNTKNSGDETGNCGVADVGATGLGPVERPADYDVQNC